MEKVKEVTAIIRFCLDFKAKPNEKSHSCWKLIELAKRRQIDAVVAHKDRLTRFGFEYLVEFKAYGVNVVVAFQDDKDYVQELMEDFVEIVKSFASRIYGQEYEKVVKCVENLEKDG
jgi:predicted site-specific integrase-resolvase